MSEVMVIGAFADEEECIEAVHALAHAGYRKPRVFSPIPCAKLLAALGHTKSPVRAIVLCGGIIGALSGFALTIGTSLYWPHYVGGKPIVSLTPFVIIAFELMILFGALSGLTGFFGLVRFPRLESAEGFLPSFSGDRFGIAVACTDADRSKVETLLRNAGAEEVVRESVA
jgi:hypothetical protein